jgi:antirestriction protein ArdC
MLEEGKSPWKKTWSASDAPKNLTTKIPYRGVNVWMLLSSPFASTPYWLTWKQVMTLKGRVKAEEAKNYEIVVFWKQLKYKKMVGGVEEEDSFPMLRYSRVYNLGQCEFSPETLAKIVPSTKINDFTPLERCETIVSGYKDCPDIRFGGDRAFYSPLMDLIQMPNKVDFQTSENYYSVLFHEMGHSTGSQSRLKRFKANETSIFGGETYSKEELVAEMTSSFLCAEANIENNTIENSVAYLAGWLKAIKNSDKNFVLSAASKAQYAAEYILGKRELVETE